MILVNPKYSLQDALASVLEEVSVGNWVYLYTFLLGLCEYTVYAGEPFVGLLLRKLPPLCTLLSFHVSFSLPACGRCSLDAVHSAACRADISYSLSLRVTSFRYDTCICFALVLSWKVATVNCCSLLRWSSALLAKRCMSAPTCGQFGYGGHVGTR
jgi:hypothetical protein